MRSQPHKATANGFPPNTWRRPGELARPIATVVALLAVVTIIVSAARVLAGVNTTFFLDDAAATLGVTPFVGFGSVLAVLLWFITATSAFTAVAATSSGGESHDQRLLLAALGAASVMLGVDDQFMLHEGLLANTLGLSELWLTIPYMIGALWLASRFWRIVLGHPDGLLLTLGVALLALSLLLDISQSSLPGRKFVEELAKLGGVAFWASFTVRASLDLLRRSPYGFVE